jgi:nucleoside transporter
MNGSIRARLSIMMFLEYVVWGAWLPLLAIYLEKYLHFSGLQMALIFNAFAIASLTAIFFGGQLADRFFSQTKFLAVCHLIGGLSMLALAYQTQFAPFFALMLLHCFFYVPTLSVTNAIAFANLNDSEKDFGPIRLWGTIGWIAASWPFIIIPIDWTHVPSMDQAGGLFAWMGTALSTLKSGKAMEAALTSTFVVAGVASLVLSAFSLTLPNKAPVATGPKDESPDDAFAPLKAIRLLGIPAILVLFIVTFFDSLVHYCYFFCTSPFLGTLGMKENWIAPAMSIGQFAEIPAMALLGTILTRLGWRKTMILGILGQAVRFGIYTLGARSSSLLWLVVASNLVHGFAYACFFAAVYIFVDKSFPRDIRTSAQSLFNVLILGVGPFLGNFLWGWLRDFVFSTNATGRPEDKVINYSQLFLVPMCFALLAAVILAVFFHPEEKAAAATSDPEF